ncbi:MAG: hypothetical protein ABIF40_04995 [archaeon]
MNEKLFPSIFYRNIENDNVYVQKCLKHLDKVPSCILDILIEDNVYIAFYSEMLLTDQPEFLGVKGLQVDPVEDPRYWDDIDMAYNDYYGSILIGLEPILDFNKVWEIKEPRTESILHEVGHAVDSRIGKLFTRRNFSRNPIFLNLMASNKEEFTPHFYKYPGEFFADCFQDYYLNPESKSQLEEDWLDMFNFIENIEYKASRKPWWLKLRIKHW